MPEPPASALPAQGALLGSDGSPMSLEHFTLLAAASDYVLLGEGHSSACDHLAQAELVRAMARAGTAPALGLEMVEEDRQPVLDRFNAGELDVDGLAGALDWPRTWGYPFDLYRPVFEAARESGLPLYGLNAPRRVVQAVSRGGTDAVAEADRAYLPSRIIMPTREQRAYLEEQFAAHLEMMGGDDKKLDGFLRVQSLWDTRMAERAAWARRATGRPLAVIAGSGHVEYGWGLAHRLAELDPGARVLLVVPWRGMEPPDPGEAHVLYYCPMSHASRLGFTLVWQEGRALVQSVEPGSKAEAAGLAPGDVLLRAMDMAVDSIWTLHKAGIRARDQGVPLALDVERAGSRLALAIPVAAEPTK